jgi:hypothetical protein
MRSRLNLSLLAAVLEAMAGEMTSLPEVKARKPDREAIETAERKRQRKRSKRLRQGRP